MNNRKAENMTVPDKKVELAPDLLIGHGRHKECYHHPDRPDLCIKVAYNEGGTTDLVREIRYLKTLSGSNLDYSVLPAYYGTIETSKGTGYVYELIKDFNGDNCMTVQDILMDSSLLEKHFDRLVDDLKLLHRNLLDNKIITMGLFPENIIVQRTAPNQTRLRIVNDMGSSTLIHLDYYISALARQHIEKRWQRFTQNLVKHHYDGRFPSPLVLELAEKIR